MPNHDVPIEDAGVWDILDWNTVAAVANTATGDPRDARGANAIPWICDGLIKAASKTIGREDERILHKIVVAWLPYADEGDRRRKDGASKRRQSAGHLAEILGARPDRLIDYIAFKWGLFKRL